MSYEDGREAFELLVYDNAGYLLGQRMKLGAHTLSRISVIGEEVRFFGKDDKLVAFSLSELRNIPGSTSPPDPDDDVDQEIYDLIAAAILDPRFREVLVNLATHDLPNHGVNLSDYPIQASGIQSSVQTSADIQQGIFGLLTPVLTQLVGGMVGAGIQASQIPADTPLPQNVQQGIFNIVLSFMKNPIFTQIVTNIVKTVAKGA